MQVITLRCPACGATLNVDGNETHFNCEYCQNPINVIKPLTSKSIIEGLTEAEQNKYRNYLSLLEQAMLAGNYTEGYTYCNKGLEINPHSAELWANKAICSLWISTVSQISEEKAMEIITYLNACKQNDKDGKIYNETAPSIAENLYYCALYRYNMIQPDQYQPSSAMTYSFDAEKGVLSCIRVIHLCFQIYPDYSYVIQALRILNVGKIAWYTVKGSNSNNAIRQGFDAIKLREKLIEEIKKDYTIEKLETKASSNYQEFCKIADEFYKMDRSFYNQYFSPIVSKFKPQKTKIVTEASKSSKRNNVIAFSVIGVIVAIIVVFIIIQTNKNKNKVIDVKNKVEFTQEEKNSKDSYDKKYLVREFLVNTDLSVFSQQTLVLADQDFTKENVKTIINFYKSYYEKIANVEYNRRFVLKLWFYTKEPSSGYNPSYYTEEEIKQQKNLVGYVFYNYDSQKYSGTIDIK